MRISCQTEPFTSYRESIHKLLDKIDAAPALAGASQILIKPNLVNASPPPVTFPVTAAKELIRYCQSHSAARILVGEGTGHQLICLIVIRQLLPVGLTDGSGPKLEKFGSLVLMHISNMHRTGILTVVIPSDESLFALPKEK